MKKLSDVAVRSWRRVGETPTTEPPGLTHPEWSELHPWLVQGTTQRGAGGAPFDLGLFSDGSPASVVASNWETLRGAVGMPRAVLARQVHEAAVRFSGAGPPGLQVTDPCDGHLTTAPGVLLAVTIADCVPVFIVEPVLRGVALLHAGWRGIAAGVLEAGLEALSGRVAAAVENLHVHLGPAICGVCYEVGSEVFAALGLAPPEGPAPVDLRSELARRAEAAGVAPAAISVSEHCTLCGDGLLFSHRGGDRGRQVAYLGIRG